MEAACKRRAVFKGWNAYFDVFILKEDFRASGSPDENSIKIVKPEQLCMGERERICFLKVPASMHGAHLFRLVCMREQYRRRQRKEKIQQAGSGHLVIRQWRMRLVVSVTDLSDLPLPFCLHLNWPLLSSSSPQHLLSRMIAGTGFLLTLLACFSRGQARHKQQIDRWMLTTWMALTPLSYWRLKKFCVVSAPLSPLLSVSDSTTFFQIWADLSPPKFHHPPLSCSILAFLCLLSAFFVSRSLFFPLLFEEKSLQGKITYIWVYGHWILWSPWTCDVVIRCDWRIKETEHKLNGSKRDKEDRRKDEMAGVMEWSKRKELASSLGWIAAEQLPSISHHFCSSRVTVATQDIWAQP